MSHATYQTYELRPTRFENVASLLIASLVLLGVIVLILLGLWALGEFLPSQVAVPVEIEQIGEGGGLGDNMELDTAVEDPGQEFEFEQPQLEETLAAVADAVARQAAILEDPSRMRKGTEGPAAWGDGRAPGKGGAPGRPRHWEVEFRDPRSIDGYARQLDFFGIELGLLLPDGRVAYASDLSSPSPTIRYAPTEEEERYYLTWQSGGLVEADKALLRRVGLNPARGKLILKFIPPDLEAQLIEKETNAAGDPDATVRATYFRVVPSGSGYEMVVADQVLNY